MNEKRGTKILSKLRDLLNANVHPTVRDAGLSEAEARWLVHHRLLTLGDKNTWSKDKGATPFEDRYEVAEITDTALSHLGSSSVSPLPAMKKKRTKPSNTLWGRLFQEAGHQCAFCPETVVESLQIHHIDGNPSENNFENLILACATCHAKITTGVIPEADVRLKKRQLPKSSKNSSPPN